MPAARLFFVVMFGLSLGTWVRAADLDKITGQVSINAEFSPYEEAPADADFYPEHFRRKDTSLYIPARILQETIERIKSITLPPGQRRPTSLNALEMRSVTRFLLRGAVAVDKVRRKYRDSRERSADLDVIFEPDVPFTGRMAIEGPRIEKFVKTIYPGLDATPEQQTHATRVISLNTALWPMPLEYGSEPDSYQATDGYFRLLALNRLDPVFDLKLANTGTKPVSITQATFEVETSDYLKDYSITGVAIPETATIVIRKSEPTKAPLDATIAPGAEVTLRIALRCYGSYLFFGTIALHDKDGVVYRTPIFAIAFLT